MEPDSRILVFPSERPASEGMAFYNSRISAHSFRHAYATRCYENGIDLLTLKSYMGHNSINSTCIYLKLAASYKDGFVNPFDQLEGGEQNV